MAEGVSFWKKAEVVDEMLLNAGNPEKAPSIEDLQFHLKDLQDNYLEEAVSKQQISQVQRLIGYISFELSMRMGVLPTPDLDSVDA